MSRLWKVLSTASEHTHWDHVALHRKYGPIVRIAPNEVSLASPEAARLVLSAGKHFYKTDFYAVFPPPENPDIFTEIREHVHAQKKKVANVPYSMAAMQQLSPFIDDTIDLFMTKLDAIAAAPAGDPRGPTVNLGDWLHWFAFDVLGEVAFSRSFGFLEQGRDVDERHQDHRQLAALQRHRRPDPRVRPRAAPQPAVEVHPQHEHRQRPDHPHGPRGAVRRKPFDKEGEGKWRGGDGRQDLLASLIKGHVKDPERFGEGRRLRGCPWRHVSRLPRGMCVLHTP